MRTPSAAFLAPPLLPVTRGRSVHHAPSRAPVARLRTGLALAAASALLGPALDGLHSATGALAYTAPLHLGPLETTAWTPALFAAAGPTIGLGALALDARFPPPARASAAPAAAVIASFVGVYAASGVLDARCVWAAGPVLAALAAGEWAALDGSVGAAAMGALAAAAGYIVEAGLVNVGGLYSYRHAEVAGLPLWIGPVYFAGGPAVAALTRALAEGFGEGSSGDR